MNKRTALLILTLTSAATPGCMTTSLLEKVSPSEKSAFNPKTKKYEKPPAKPGYLVLLPATFAGDVVTVPLWIPFAFLFSGIRG